jgi:uncharacterized protein involved in exopolysaccharide biosynthesis
MNSETEKTDSDNEISLIDLFAVLWRWKVMIIVITLTAAVGVVIYSNISRALPPEKSYMPNVYTPEALMLIDNRSSSGSLSSMLGSMGGLASLMGVNVSTSASTSQLAVFLVETNSFLDSVVDNFDLIRQYRLEKDLSPRANSRIRLKKSLIAEFNSSTSVLSITFTNKDPVFARDVVNYSVALLGQRFDELGLDKNKIEKENLEINIANTFQEIMKLEEESRNLEQSVAFGLPYGRLPAITTDITRIELELDAKKSLYTQLVVQYELLKVSMASESPVFQILEMAEVPDFKSGPNRGIICIIVTLAAGFLSVFLAFALNAISNIKKDPQAMAKLRGINEK